MKDMDKKLKTLFLTIVLLTCCTISQAQHLVHNIRIDPDNALGGNVSDFFESVEFIPLETTKESTFGRVYQMKVTDDYLIIRDNDTRSVLIFTTAGKFHAKINQDHRDFTLDRANEEILILGVNTIYYYDYHGKLLRQREIQQDIEALYMFRDGTLALNKERPFSPAAASSIRYDVLYTDSLGGTIDKLFPYNPKFGVYDYNKPFDLFNDLGDGTCIYAFPYRYAAYELRAGGIAAAYHFVFPEKYSLPKGFDNDSLFLNKRKEYIFNPKNTADYYRFQQLSPFFRHGDYVFFNTNSSYFTYNNDLLYDLRSKTAYSLNRLTGDSISCYFPVLHSGSQQKINALYKGCLYTSMPASALIKLNERNKQYGKETCTQLADFFAANNGKANSVIIRSKFK